jgi:ketosteroid isomerase-like protein
MAGSEHDMSGIAEPHALLERLVGATNAHDLDALVDCFAGDYENVTPAHPARGFTGQDQVRRNWEQIFAAVPDVTVTVAATAVDDSSIWSEWDMRGTRPDGSAHHLRGVIIFEVDGQRARRARFYLEPVDDGAGDVDDAVRRQVVR